MRLIPLVLLALAFVTIEQPLGGDDKVKQKFCPVMTTDEIDPDNAKSVTYKGVKIYLCCDTCVAKFNREPSAYLDAKLIPALAGQELPKRAIEQVYCPVLKERKVNSKDPSTMYKGVKVYFYNEVARQRFEKDPARYADRKVLPQLPKE
jgi:YHS domain-containing protein